MATTYPAEHEVALRNGTTVQIRPLEPADEAALAAFLAALSPRSSAFRFFSGGVRPDVVARRAVDLHYPESFALVALQGERIVGHGMYARAPSDAVEVAFAIADELQGVGLGTILLGEISAAAAANGFDTLVAEVMPENHRMLEVFADSGLPLHVRAEPGVVHVRMPSGVPLTVGRDHPGWNVGRPRLASSVKTVKGSPMNRTVVVGYDGSQAARKALDYAASRVNGGRLFVVTAVVPPPEWMGSPGWQQMVDEEHQRGGQLLEDAVTQLPETVDCSTELLEGPAADAIVGVADARHADAIVVGSRGLGRVRAALGSVSHDVLHLANCPVVVVPERAARKEE
jgi:nucleotide-binding universal stress UspA family protein/GNAT superfamily N-acetyltransferase